MRWIGHLGGITGLFDGERIFTINSLGNNNVKFTHQEIFTRLLIPLLSQRINKSIRSYEAMNKSLKTRAEKEK